MSSLPPSPPSLSEEQFISLVSQPSSAAFNLFPLSLSIDADLETPVSAYLKLTSRSSAAASPSFLLESVAGGERQARFSYIGKDPYKVLSQDNVDPLIEIEKEMKKYRPLQAPSGSFALPDFFGGAVGYLSYDCVSYFEPKVPKNKSFLVRRPKEGAEGKEGEEELQTEEVYFPESLYMFCREVVAFDHIQHTIHLIANVFVEREEEGKEQKTQQQKEQQYREAYQLSLTKLLALYQQVSLPLSDENQLINQAVPVPLSPSPSSPSPVSPSSSSSSSSLVSTVPSALYKHFVSSLQENIKAGEIIQAVPSQRASRLLSSCSALDVYRQLRILNPSPYMFYVDLLDFQLVGASPEQLVRVGVDSKVTTHPIAGTRRRGKTPQEDLFMAQELLASEKERAEHIMLVDLGRNDLGRVCRPGSVRVDSLMHLEKYSHVMHIVSHVSGLLAEGKTPFDALRAVFPAGTVSGAPKVRAMQLVAELEANRRGVYAGSVGFFCFSGLLDTSIAIRTIVVKEQMAFLQAGGGIVFDSKPDEEWKETVNKMRATAVAIERAEMLGRKKQERLQELERAQAPQEQEQEEQVQQLISQISLLAKKKGIQLEAIQTQIQKAFQ